MRYTERLADADAVASVGRTADSYDNALAGVQLFKAELPRNEGPGKHPDDLEIATAKWVDRSNHHRPFGYSDYLTPVEAEQAHYRHHQARDRRSLT